MTPWTKLQELEARIHVLEDGRKLRLVAWIASMVILTAVAGLAIFLVITREQRDQRTDYKNCIARRNIIAELHVAYATQIKVKPSSIPDPNLRLLVKISQKNQRIGYKRVKKNQVILRCKPILSGHEPVQMTQAQRIRFLKRYLQNRINPNAREGIPEVLPHKPHQRASGGGGLIQTPNQGGQLQGPRGPQGPQGPKGPKGGTTPTPPPTSSTPTPVPPPTPTTPTPPPNQGPVGSLVCNLLGIGCK